MYLRIYIHIYMNTEEELQDGGGGEPGQDFQKIRFFVVLFLFVILLFYICFYVFKYFLLQSMSSLYGNI